MTTGKSVILFGKYIGYNVGGAEQSILALMKEREREGARIKVILVEGLSAFGAAKNPLSLPDTWQVERISLSAGKRFNYLLYYLDKPRIRRVFSTQDPSALLYAYGITAPAAINSFPGKSVYLVRSETGLGYNENYYAGWRRLARGLYALIEYPFFAAWHRDLFRAIRRSRVIANSNFIADLARRLTGIEAEVVYPTIDFERLRRRYEAVRDEVKEKGIVFVGDAIIKGTDIATAIARSMPEHQFYFFTRKATERHSVGNIIYVPWQASPEHVYKHAKLVIVPSRWMEAFGRVAAEACHLGLPVVASNRGGLPEALNHRREYLLDDIEDINEWCRRIRRFLCSAAASEAKT